MLPAYEARTATAYRIGAKARPLSVLPTFNDAEGHAAVVQALKYALERTVDA